MDEFKELGIVYYETPRLQYSPHGIGEIKRLTIEEIIKRYGEERIEEDEK